MDSRLDAILRVGFRPLEKSDTWQGIQREEKTDDRKRRDHDETRDDKDPFTDDTVLSVAALHGFLSGLLRQEEAPAATPPSQPDATAAAPPEGRHESAHAAQAYRNTARQTGSENSAPPAPPTPASGGPAIALSPTEMRDIHGLLADLDILKARGVTMITLKQDGTFLESLRMSVRAAIAPTSPG